MNPQVLIIGAGPVGLTMALALARQGVRLRIVEKNAQRTDKSKALVLWPRTLELLDIQGCARPFVDAGLMVRDARILADDRELVHVSFDVARSVYRFALMLPQSDTERLLQEQLDRLGIVVERRTELLSFADHGDAVSAVLRRTGRSDSTDGTDGIDDTDGTHGADDTVGTHDTDGTHGTHGTDDTVRTHTTDGTVGTDGTEEKVHADWLVGCDGAHSSVRHGLASASFDGSTLPSNWVLADLSISGAALPTDLTICFSKHGLLLFFPIGGGRFRVIAETGAATAGALPDPTLAEIQSLVDARGPSGLHLHDTIWLSRFRINERKVRDYRVGRVFLAGDAAHVHSPAGGQGMNTGMQDALNLAWKLTMVCQGEAGDDLLASYSPERSAVGDQVLRNAGTLTKVGLVSNPLLRQLRALAAGVVDHLPALKQRFVDQMTEIELHYPDSPLTRSPRGASNRPAGGERAPDVGLTDSSSRRRLHEVLGTAKFAVLSVGAPIVALSAAHERIAVAVQAADSPDYAAGHVYLIRPDAYVALSVGGDDPGTIVDALERIAAPR